VRGVRIGKLFHLERHRLGPRVYVLGQRVHECALGLALLAVAPAGLLDDLAHPRAMASVASTGLWLVVKDWRDLVPSKRNTSAWSPVLHRVPRDDERL
jgi:hypothetical protein